MNWFIFKNKDSRDFNNLIVNTLPPVTRAPKRVETTEIDGRDGDIIEILGYSSYDKEINITLLNDDNIDDILNWLNGRGYLITSLEPDKKYKVEILNEVSFERNGKLRTAKITLHSQPFKYSTNEEYVEVTTGDNISNLGNYKAKPIIHLEGEGEVEFSLNEILTFKYTFDDDKEVYIDCEEQEAYLGNKLKNQNMIGEFPVLNAGTNKIEFTGNVEVEILPKSRWL